MDKFNHRTMYMNFIYFVKDNREKNLKEIEQILRENELDANLIDAILDKVLRVTYLTWFEGYLISEFEQKFE